MVLHIFCWKCPEKSLNLIHLKYQVDLKKLNISVAVPPINVRFKLKLHNRKLAAMMKT